MSSSSRTGFEQTSIHRIEDLREPVRGSCLDVVQMGKAPVTGTLFYGQSDGVSITSGSFIGKVWLRGPITSEGVTVSVGLQRGPGSRQLYQEVQTGVVGLFDAGTDQEGMYNGHSVYLAASLTEDRLHREARLSGVIVDDAAFQNPGLYPQLLDASLTSRLRKAVLAIHQGSDWHPESIDAIATDLLHVFLLHAGREPRNAAGATFTGNYARIVKRAQSWIEDNLEESISLNALADEACTSRRTLHRAFLEVMDESPTAYIRRLRLHRIRHDLLAEEAGAYSIAAIANRWGVGELGRFSGRYRSLFGELPSETVGTFRKAQPNHKLAESA